jgi:hypothetical protein
LRLSIWTAALAGALLLPVLSFVTPQVRIAVPRVLPAPAAASVAEPSSRFAGAVGVVRVQEPSSPRHSRTWPEIFVIVWAAGVSLAMLCVFVGLYFSRLLVRAPEELIRPVREE